MTCLMTVKVKSLCLPKCHAIKTYLGNGDTDLRILNLGASWIASRIGNFTSGKEPPIHIAWGLDEPQSQSGRIGEEKRCLSLPLLEIEPRSSNP